MVRKHTFYDVLFKFIETSFNKIVNVSHMIARNVTSNFKFLLVKLYNCV